jgi:DNA-directed RNA polymerase subunit RPC12/RpoP
MQENPEISKEKIHRYPCVVCGANLVFEPKGGKLTCPYCGHSEIIPQSKEQIEERSYEAFLRPRAEMLQPLAKEAMQVSCNSCGAVITFVPPETAKECDFCGAKIVAQPKAADPLVAPEGVLPFSITNQQAAANLRAWISSRWFAPNALKEFARPDKIDSIYIPYWTYDAYTTSHYSGERGEYYYETEWYTETDAQGNRQQRSRQVRKTRWYSVSGTVERWFDDVLVPATKSLPVHYIEKLEPWDFVELKAYEPAYLAGHKAQTYQVALDEGFERFKQIAAGFIDGDVRNDIGGDEQRIHDVATHYSAITFKHLLLPVYAGAYRFNNKVYQIVINGRTGVVQGMRPYSYLKIGCLVAAILGIILFIIFLVAIIGAVSS